MEVLLVVYRSGLTTKEVADLIESRADRYKRVKGLLQKLYIRDESTGQAGGIYVFDSKESLSAFQNSDLAKGIGKAYRVSEPPTRRVFKVVKVLFESEGRRLLERE